MVIVHPGEEDASNEQTGDHLIHPNHQTTAARTRAQSVVLVELGAQCIRVQTVRRLLTELGVQILVALVLDGTEHTLITVPVATAQVLGVHATLLGVALLDQAGQRVVVGLVAASDVLVDAQYALEWVDVLDVAMVARPVEAQTLRQLSGRQSWGHGLIRVRIGTGHGARLRRYWWIAVVSGQARWPMVE